MERTIFLDSLNATCEYDQLILFCVDSFVSPREFSHVEGIVVLVSISICKQPPLKFKVVIE